jgi:hypothetical protein
MNPLRTWASHSPTPTGGSGRSCVARMGDPMIGTTTFVRSIGGRAGTRVVLRLALVLAALLVVLLAAGPAWANDTTSTGSTFSVRPTDLAGNVGDPATRTPAVDTVAPQATAPIQSLPQGAQVGTTKVPVSFVWTASDNLTAAAQLKSTLQQRTRANGTTWGDWAQLVRPTTRKTATASLPAGATYRQFRIAVTDQAGNVGYGPAGPAFRVWPYQARDDPAIAYSGIWGGWAYRYWFGGGFARVSMQHGATATLTATGRNLALVAPLSSSGGPAKVCLDPGTADQSCATVSFNDAHSLTLSKELFTRNGLSATTHTVQVTNLSDSGDRVFINAFVALR